MPLATEPVNFTWSLPSLTCRHGVTPQDADFRGEFFQKVKETKTTLDRIYLSSLIRNKEKAIIYDYEKWARKGGNLAERKADPIPQLSASKHRPPPVNGPIRPLGVDNRKIEAALQCGLWDDGKQKKKKNSVKIPHIMARVQSYDFEDDYWSDVDKHNPQGTGYTLDSSKVFRAMEEETREKASQRLKKGKCGGWKTKKRIRQVSPSMIDHRIDSMRDHVIESEDEYTSSEVRVTIEEKHSNRRGGIITKVTHKQKLDFSTLKKRGAAQSDTVEYRLPKLSSTPIIRETEEEEPNEDVVKLPLLKGVKKRPSADKPKRSKHCKKLLKHRRKKRSDEEDDSSIRLNIDDDIETELSLETPILEEVSSKLSDISQGGSDRETDKTNTLKLLCKKATADDPLTEYPFMSMGMDDVSDSDEECLCDECLALMSSSKQPALGKKPLKSILSPRRRKQTTSTGGGKGVRFAEMENLEDIRLISPLSVRNENMKRFEEEERRERLKQRDIKRRERRRRERERFAALNQKSTKKMKARQNTADNADSTAAGLETTSECEETFNGVSHGNKEVSSNNENVISSEIQEQNINKNGSNGSLSLDEESVLDNGKGEDTQIPPRPDSEVREVEALMLDPQDGRLYDDIVLEKGNGKITVAQLGYRIKSIFDRDLPPPASPKPSSSPNKAEVDDHETEKTSTDDEADDKDKPFVTKCVDWKETTESASTSRSQTPVEKEDMSEFIMSMKNCRYIRWSKSYEDMLKKMEL